MSSIFELKASDAGARAGVLRTAHGDVPTPAFMPVATQGSVKALDPDDLREIGATIVLANTYHLYLRPGVETVSRLGGLHGFMSWPGPVLTDSGGFQGFSLEHMRELDESGIVFKSHLDGSLHRFTPESAVAHQRGLGADVIMPLDVCVASDSARGEVEAAAARTGRWAARSLEAHGDGEQSLFGIVQGGVFEDIRERSAAEITAMGFPGYAIGGLSVGESKAAMYETAGYTAALLPADRPRYLMGVGAPEDLVECVARGVDMFDCVLPTRVARGGSLYVPGGPDQRRHRAVQGTRRARRPLVRLPDLREALDRVPEPPVPRPGAARLPAGYDTQRALRAAADGGDARRDRRGPVRRLEARLPRALSPVAGRMTTAPTPLPILETCA